MRPSHAIDARTLRWPVDAITALVSVSAVLAILTYVTVAALRVGYPFELEWMEGAMVDHVRQILVGRPLYGPPSLSFIAFDYPPLYFYVSASVAAVTGIGLLPLRLVSVSCSMWCLYLIWRVVHRETGHRFPALVATGLFAATFAASGAWFDLARIDSLLLALMLAALYFTRFFQSGAGWTMAAGAMLLAFLTKQSAVVVAAPLLVYCVMVRWRLGTAVTLGLVMLTGAIVWALDARFGGWYTYYVFGIPARIQAADTLQAAFWSGDILGRTPLAFALALGYALTTAGRKDRREALVYPLGAIGMIFASWVSRLHAGGYDNVLMPAHAALALLSGLAIHDLSRTDDGDRPLVPRMYGLVCCLVQFAMLAYNPMAHLPRAADRLAGEHLIKEMAQASGDVFVPQHGYVALLANKAPSAHAMAIYDIIRAGGDRQRDRLLEALTCAIRQQRFAMVVVDRADPWLQPELDTSYVVRKRAFDDPRAFWPVTGLRIRPELIYVPRRSPTTTVP
jgi:hypothetical protein